MATIYAISFLILGSMNANFPLGQNIEMGNHYICHKSSLGEIFFLLFKFDNGIPIDDH
jgi:hypothetical protein